MRRSASAGMRAIGSVAPNFRLAAAQGPDVALEDYRSKQHVVLWFSKGLF